MRAAVHCAVVGRVVDFNGAVFAAHRTALEASVVKLHAVRAELAVAAVPGARHSWGSFVVVAADLGRLKWWAKYWWKSLEDSGQ